MRFPAFRSVGRHLHKIGATGHDTQTYTLIGFVCTLDSRITLSILLPKNCAREHNRVRGDKERQIKQLTSITAASGG